MSANSNCDEDNQCLKEAILRDMETIFDEVNEQAYKDAAAANPDPFAPTAAQLDHLKKCLLSADGIEFVDGSSELSGSPSSSGHVSPVAGTPPRPAGRPSSIIKPSWLPQTPPWMTPSEKKRFYDEQAEYWMKKVVNVAILLPVVTMMLLLRPTKTNSEVGFISLTK
jgi:hypothetical protein